MAGINAFDRLNYGEFNLPTLQELMIAPSYMQEQYNKAQEEYLASQAMAADVATRFQPGIDDEAIKINKDFQDNIDADIENLSRNGLTPSIKRNLLQRKVDFTNNILPLNKAALDRENMAKAAYEAKLKNPSLITKDPMMVSLTNWIKDPESHELRPISGLEVAERTRAQMTAIRNYIDQNLPELHKTGILYQYFTAARYGATESDIAQALAYNQGVGISKASNLAKLIITAAQNVVNSTGVYDYYGADSPEADRVWDYAESEFNNALGTTKWGNLTDEYSMRYDLEALKNKGSKDEETESSTFPYLNTRTNIKVKGKVDKTQAFINTLRKIKDSGGLKDKIITKPGLNNFTLTRTSTGPTPYDQTTISKEDQLIELYEQAKKLGIPISDTNNASLETLISDSEKFKSEQLIGTKEYVFNPVTDKTFINTLESFLVSQSESKELLSDKKMPEELLTDSGHLARSVEVVLTNEGLVLREYGKKDKKNKDYIIDTSRLTNDLNLAIQQAYNAYNSDSSNYQLTEEQIDILRRLYPDKYGNLSDLEIQDLYIDEYLSSTVRSTIGSGYSYLSAQNKPIDIK